MVTAIQKVKNIKIKVQSIILNIFEKLFIIFIFIN